MKTTENAPKKYLICGYYGYKNSGDEALLKSVIKDIKEVNSENEIVVLSKDDYIYNFSGVSSINRFDFLKLRSAAKACDILVMGGGSLLQDETSSKSLYYYLLVIFWGNHFGKKTYLYSNGLGPISSKFNRYLTKKVLNKVSEISFRDKGSYKLALEIGVENKHMRVAADSVFSLDYEIENNQKEKRIAILIREWRESEMFFSQLAKYADNMADSYGYEIVFVPLKLPDDKLVSEKIISKMNTYAKIVEMDDIRDLISYFESCELVVSMRFHGLVYASLAGTLSLGLSYDEKVTSICETLDIAYQYVNDINAKNLIELSESILKDYDSKQAALSADLQELRNKAKINKEILYSL